VFRILFQEPYSTVIGKEGELLVPKLLLTDNGDFFAQDSVPDK
jgi:hypothetical protein